MPKLTQAEMIAQAVTAALAAQAGTTTQKAQTTAPKAATAPDVSGIAKAIIEGTCEVRTSQKGKPYAVVKFNYGGRAQNLNVWL